MTNLKGSTIDKQIRDANFRLAAFKTSRRGDNLTHSNGVRITRDKIFKDLKSFIEKEGLSGKLNLLMTTENMEKFVEGKYAISKPTEQMKFITSFSSLIQGLEQSNIRISLDSHFFDKYREEARDAIYKEREKEDFSQTNRYIKSIDNHISKINDEQSQIYAQVLKSTGLRRDEAETVMKNIFELKDTVYDEKNTLKNDKMSFRFKNNQVVINGIFGKGGREYTVDKYIPLSTYNKIKNLNKINSSSTLNKKLMSRKAHDYRYTFARDFYTRAKEAGYSEKESLAMTSQELGHNRIAMTRYYLARSQA